MDADKLLNWRQTTVDKGAEILAPGMIGEQALACIAADKALSLESLLAALTQVAAGTGAEASKAAAAIKLINDRLR